MKNLSIFCAATLICFGSIAQVEVKTKTTTVGKKDIVLEEIPDTKLDNFTVSFTYWLFGSDEGGNNAKGTYNSVSAVAELGNFDNALAQEITDEAYAYFLDSWKARGSNVTCHSAAEIEATKAFAKDKEKGKAEIMASGAYLTENKFAKTLTVLPTNTTQVKKEAYGNYSHGNAQYFVDYTKNASTVAFNCGLTLFKFKTGFGTQSFIKAEPALTIASGSGISKSVKAKFGIFSMSTSGDGNTEFVDSIDEGDTWKFNINRDKFKSAALEVIKKSIDDQFAEYDAFIAKEKG